MYIRFSQPPADLFDWYEEYLQDEEEIDVKAGGGQAITIGQMCRQFLTKLEWFSTLFPRIPVPIQKQIEQRLNDYDRQNGIVQAPEQPQRRERVERPYEREQRPKEYREERKRTRSRSPRRQEEEPRHSKRSRSRSRERHSSKSSKHYQDRSRSKERRDKERKKHEYDDGRSYRRY